MCKTFKLITSNGIDLFESIGDVFVHKNKNKEERVVSHEHAQMMHDDALNRCSFVRMRKYEHEIIL